ncbi:MAG TPA: M14 family metallopeptidase, partial [Candidatus Paceibacterota bacterium]
ICCDITAYNYGTGAKNLLFVGGIHGGYSWNTASVAYELMKYLETNPSIVPSNIKVTVIPVLNPDGLNSAVGTTSSNFMKSDVSKSEAKVIASRFNANNVDLNRNFDCDWKESGKWQNKTVSGGTNPFSEPETQAIKSYIEKNKPVAVVIWYSSAGGVYASNCHSGVLPETKTIGMAYADASGYKYDESFDFYATTGDMANWLAKVNTPGISILLTNHTDIEWNKNKAGVEALLEYYSK